MKNFALAIIVLICTASTVNAQKYIFPEGTEVFLKGKFGYNPAYVVKESKEKTIKKVLKEQYITPVVGKNGMPQNVDANPNPQDKVLEYDGVLWYNITTGQLLSQQKSPVVSQEGGKQASDSKSTKEPRQKGQGPNLEQLAQVGAGIYQVVTGRRTGGFGGRQDLGGLGNGPVGNQSGLQ